MSNFELTPSENAHINALFDGTVAPILDGEFDIETVREIISISKEPGSDAASLAAEFVATLADQEYRKKVSALTEALLPLGILVNFPRIINGKIPAIIDATKKAAESQSGRDDLAQLLALETLDPIFRAFSVVQAAKLKHLSDIGQYLESATLAYFEGRTFDAANGMIVSIERLLLSHVGWRLGDAEQSTNKLRDRIAAIQPTATEPLLRSRFRMYRRILLRFLEQQFQERSGRAARSGLFQRTLLNRAFILHTNEPGSYYGLLDLISLFGFLDLYGELISHQYGANFVGVLPDVDEDREERRRQYWTRLLGDFVDDGSRRGTIKALMGIHPRYVDPGETNLFALATPGPEQNQLLGHAMITVGAEALIQLVAEASVVTSKVSRGTPSPRLELVSRLFEGLLAMGMFAKSQPQGGCNFPR